MPRQPGACLYCGAETGLTWVYNKKYAGHYLVCSDLYACDGRCIAQRLLASIKWS